MRVDVHQHLWTEPLLAALGCRSEPPYVRRRTEGWRLVLAGEPESWLDPAETDIARRAELVSEDQLDHALISVSSPLGFETLPHRQAETLVEAYHRGVDELPDVFGAWGAVARPDAGPGEVDGLLDRGYAGVTLPATSLMTPQAIDRCGALLERLEARNAPLFVHPGPSTAAAGTDSWWPAMTDYIAQMNTAWHAFVHRGRRAHPRLRVVFAMLAGGAPLHLERLAARRGPVESAVDPGFFYDTSSYGPRAIDAMVRVVGADQLVHGSDRPVARPHPDGFGAALTHATRVENTRRLLGGAPAPR